MRLVSNCAQQGARARLCRERRSLAMWLGLGWLLVAPLARTQDVTESVPSPTNVTVYQTTYGGSASVLISWAPAARYDEVDVLADGESVALVSGERTRVELPIASVGSVRFGLQGVVGSRRSVVSEADFVVLADSPLTEPIEGLRCEFLYLPQGDDGLVRVAWMLGSQPWVEGRLTLVGSNEFEVFGPETDVVELAVTGEGPFDVELVFRDADGYFSEPFEESCPRAAGLFRRGDCDGSSRMNITDAILLLNHLFKEDRRWFCDDACDYDDDGNIDIEDPLGVLFYFFRSGPPPAIPGSETCGSDATEDFLGGVCADCNVPG